MFTKSKRIHSKEFALIQKGVFKNTPYFDVRVSEGTTLKVACVVKTKLFKNAVLRNKARRRMYSLAEKALQNKVGFFIFYPKANFLNTPYTLLEQTLVSLL